MAEARLGRVKVGEKSPAAIVGVINLSTDSFYGGSIVRGESAVLERARVMVEQGASIIDVGAMGTGPKSKPVSPEKEMFGLVSAIRTISKLNIPVSTDTQRAEVAKAAVEAGATIINDISGLKSDARMADVIADAGCSAILMATKNAPGDVYKIGEIRRALGGSLDKCRSHGIPLGRVVVDPAIGYWPARLARLGSKTATSIDIEIISGLDELKSLGRPICVGISRKSFIGEVLGLPNSEDRLVGSLAATAIAVINGASVVRTHDVRETLQAVRLAEAIRDAGGS